jgi:CubicO group peptidase (beta-lactamase class C family)
MRTNSTVWHGVDPLPSGASVMSTRIAISVLLASWVLTACQAEKPATRALASKPLSESTSSADDVAGARADATIAQVMSRLHVPGMALVVVRDGKVVKQGVYGTASLELGVPVTEGTRFQIASATKVLTATLVMLLVQDQTLALDAPVRRYLPDAPPAWERITIAQLAAHASGIPEPPLPTDTPLTELVATLAQQPLAFAPGAKAQYGLSDLYVLTHVIEKLTGKPYDELLQERLGLQCTGFDHVSADGLTRRADVIPGRGGVYRWEGDRQRSAEHAYWMAAASSGGAFACVGDLARWAIAMDEGKLLSPASEALAATPFALTDGKDASWGVVFTTFTLRGHRAYGHPGGPALGDIIRVPDQKLTVAVLSNQKTMYPNTATVIAQLYLPAATLPPAVREAPELRAQLEAVDPKLVAALPPLDRIELIGDDRYRATYGDIVIGWRVPPSGEITQFVE